MKTCENKWSRIGVVLYSALATPVMAIGTLVFGIITQAQACKGCKSSVYVIFEYQTKLTQL